MHVWLEMVRCAKILKVMACFFPPDATCIALNRNSLLATGDPSLAVGREEDL